MRQTSFQFLKDYKKEFGGSLLSGKRKTRRPLSTKAPMHLILKADHKVFNPANQSLQKLIRRIAGQFDIKLYDLAVNWSHIHFLIKIKDRKDYVGFIRALTSCISQAVVKSKGLKEKLFTLRPFTRILSWGRDLKNLFSYITLNQMEAWGLIKREKKEIPKGRKQKRRLPIS